MKITKQKAIQLSYRRAAILAEIRRMEEEVEGINLILRRYRVQEKIRAARGR